jgi:hypothetical protein
VIADPEFLTNEDFRTRQVRLMEGLGRPFLLLPFSINADATEKTSSAAFRTPAPWWWSAEAAF